MRGSGLSWQLLRRGSGRYRTSIPPQLESLVFKFQVKVLPTRGSYSREQVAGGGLHLLPRLGNASRLGAGGAAGAPGFVSCPSRRHGARSAQPRSQHGCAGVGARQEQLPPRTAGLSWERVGFAFSAAAHPGPLRKARGGSLVHFSMSDVRLCSLRAEGLSCLCRVMQLLGFLGIAERGGEAPAAFGGPLTWQGGWRWGRAAPHTCPPCPSHPFR